MAVFWEADLTLWSLGRGQFVPETGQNQPIRELFGQTVGRTG